MDITESVVCAHCHTRVYRQWIVDHLKEELLSSAQHCSPCSDILKTTTDLLCAIHQYGHQKIPIMNITCSRCFFKAGSVEKFVEHLQMRCEEELFSCDSVGFRQDPAAGASYMEQRSFTFTMSHQQKKDKGEGVRCEKTIGTHAQSENSVGQTADWDRQQFQQMMSTLLTDSSGKGCSRKSFEEEMGQCSKLTINMASVHGNQQESTINQQVKECEGSKEQSFSCHTTVEKSTENVEIQKTTDGYEDVMLDSETSIEKSKTDKKHERSKTKKQQLECHICNYSGQKKDLESHMLIHGKVEYKCYSCDFIARSLKNLCRHQLKHQKIYKCRYCDFTTRWHNSLVLHEKRHTGEGMMKCGLCDYVTPDKDGLLKHQIKHTGEKPFACGQCEKSFARKCELKRHELRHAGTRSAMCHICGDTFLQNQTLLHHIRAQHDGLKAYKCDQCPFETGYYSSLLTHRRAYHTDERPYRCEFEGCNYAAASTSQLKVHRRRHTGEKPFKCNMCSYASADNAGLRKHMRKHSNLRPYKCNLCDFDTKHSFLLRKHKETIHNTMNVCRIDRRKLASVVTTDVSFSTNDVPMEVFNLDLKTTEDHSHG